MKKLHILLTVIVLVGVFILGGCSQQSETPTTPATSVPATTATTAPASTTASTSTTAPSPTTVAPKSGGTFKIGTSFSPRSGLGWFADGMNFRGNIDSDLMTESLIRCDYNGNFTPHLATAWETAPDQKSITLTLRKGVKYHDGSDFNATVVKWNIDECISAKVTGVAGWTSVDIVDDYKVRINIPQINCSVLYALATARMMSKATYDQQGGGKDGQEYLRFHPVGTGPFKFDSYEPNVSLKVTKFNNYWQEGKPYLDAVELQYIADPLTTANAFEAGEIDAYIKSNPAKIENDFQQEGYSIYENYAGFSYLAMDSKNADSPYSSLKVRQAIDYAIDRDSITKALGYGYWLPSPQFAFPDTVGYVKDLQPRAYNPDKAKQLLAEAGYSDGFKTTLIGSPMSDRDAVTSLQVFLSKVGIDAEINMVDMATFQNTILEGWNNGLITGGSSVTANPNDAYSAFWSQKTPFFPCLLKPDEFEALYDAASSSPEVNPELQKQITQFIFDSAMFLPLWAQKSCGITQPYVNGCNFYQMQIWSMWSPADVWLNK